MKKKNNNNNDEDTDLLLGLGYISLDMKIREGKKLC